MSFNKGYELKKFEAHWEKLRIEYAAAGMTEDAIQKMYDYDRQQFNSERTFVERTQEFTAPAYESSEEEASPLMLRYQEAITTKDTYHETKSKFVWIGEIEDEHLLSALEKLSDEDLELLTLYIYEGYSTVELSKPDSFRASVLRGMMHFVELYHGEFSEERLVRALGSVHPMEIYRVGRDNPAKLPGWKKYVFPIYMAYNGKGRKDALPMKF